MKAEKGFMHLLIAGEMILLVLLVIFGVAKKVAGLEEQTDIVVSTQNNQIDNLVNEKPEDTEETESIEEIEPTIVFSEEVETILSQMTVEEKVAQLFIVSPEALTENSRVTIAGEGTRRALTTYPIGGMVYTRRNYLGQVQMRDLLQGAQTMSNEISGIALFEGMMIELGEATIIASVMPGNEDRMVELISSANAAINPVIENMEHILYVNEKIEIPQEITETLCCYNVTGGEESAVEALCGGADMLCVTEGFVDVYESVLEAVNTGDISEDILKQAVGRILTRKEALSQ